MDPPFDDETSKKLQLVLRRFAKALWYFDNFAAKGIGCGSKQWSKLCKKRRLMEKIASFLIFEEEEKVDLEKLKIFIIRNALMKIKELLRDESLIIPTVLHENYNSDFPGCAATNFADYLEDYKDELNCGDIYNEEYNYEYYLTCMTDSCFDNI